MTGNDQIESEIKESTHPEQLLMEAEEVDGVLRVVEFSLSQVKWKLRPSSKRRLETDILALITEMRPVIMVDYGGKMPELQERLCSFLSHCQKESSVFEFLKVMVLEDMIYLIHTRSFANFMKSSLDMETQVLFIDLEQDPPKIVAQNHISPAVLQLQSIQKRFSTVIQSDGILQSEGTSVFNDDAAPKSSAGNFSVSTSSMSIDLSSWIRETQVTIPSLNGWLLGYPVVYLFSKEHIQDAVYNLSTKSLHLFHLFVNRNVTSNRVSQREELMSFSIPYELSLDGSDEPWAKAFLARMQTKLERCKQVWGSVQMEVRSCYPQAIAL